MTCRRNFRSIAAHLLAIVASLIAIIPVYLICVNALKSSAQSSSMGVEFPNELHLENFVTVIEQGKLTTSFLNSMFYASGASIIATLFSALAAFVLSRALSKHMKEKKAGKIVCLTSLTLTGHWDGFVPYIASKGAMYGLVKGLSRELGRHNINVNGVNPGAIVSEAEWRHFGEKREEYHQWILTNQCLKRRIEPKDVANLILFLSSPQADLITGQDVHVDGGW